MAKVKSKKITLEEALVPVDEQPYEVPENWCWTYLLNGFAECKDGNRKPINASERAEREGDIPYYGATGQAGWIDDYLTDEQLVLLGEDGAPFLELLKDKAYLIEGKAWVNNHAHIIKSHYGEVGNKYILHYLNVFNFHGYVNGTTRLKLTQASMRTIPVPLPPLAEQKRIVEQIESLFAKLDEAYEKTEIVLNNSYDPKNAILELAYSGKLTQKWRKNNHYINNVLDEIRKYSLALAKKEQRNIEKCQKTIKEIVLEDGTVWYETQIGSVGVVTNGSTPSRKCDEYWNGNIPWVSSGEVRNNIISYTREQITELGFENSSVKKLPKGTVLIAMIGEGKTRGQSSVLDIEATTNQNVAAIVIEHGYINPKFLWYWLQKEYKKNREKGAGSGPQALNCQRVRELKFIVPSIEEQNEIVNVLERLMEQEEQATLSIERVLEQVVNIKKSILSKAFRGELGTNNLKEESSIELLKRIIEDN